MKKIIFASFTLIVLLFLGFKSADLPSGNVANCDQNEIKKMLAPLLKPFIADGFKTTKIMFKKQPQKKEVEIPLYFGENYRIIFLTSQLPMDIGISIYNKSATSKKRTLLFSSKDVPKAEVLKFATDRAKDFYVEYDIPATDSIKSGCVSFMIGYESTE